MSTFYASKVNLFEVSVQTGDTPACVGPFFTSPADTHTLSVSPSPPLSDLSVHPAVMSML